jgi:hypothetical protein
MSTADKITVLHCQNGIAAKTFHGDGQVRPYRAGMYFRAEELPCGSLEDLTSILLQLQALSRAFIIRGEAVEGGTLANAILRRTNANFRDVPHHWIMLDIDGVPLPLGMEPLSNEALEHVIRLLPREFHGVSFIVQWSNSAGLKPGVIKVHLWFWLEKPLGSAELRAWANRLPLLSDGRPLIDSAVFRTVQPHYTARPIFDGLADPVPVRTLHVKLEKDSVALDIAPSPAITMPDHSALTRQPATVARIGGKIINGREEHLRQLRYGILRDERPSSLSEYRTLVWERFCDECETGPTSASSNTYTKDSVAAKCQYDWDKFQRGEFEFQRSPVAVLAPFPDRTVPLDVGLAQLRGVIQGYLKAPEHTVIRITSGAGKTSTLCAELIKTLHAGQQEGTKKVAHLYLSTHKLKDEIAVRLRKLDPSLVIKNVIGRVPEMCARYELTSQLRDLHLSIQRTCCDASRTRGFEGEKLKHLMKCPHFDNCRYQSQFDGSGDVYLFAKQYLQASRRADVAPPNFVIIDEEFISNLVEIREAGLEDLLKVPHGTSVAVLKALQLVRDALAMGKPVLSQLREADFDAAALRQHAHDMSRDRNERLTLRMLPGMAANDIARQAARIGPESVAFLTLKALAVEMEHSRDEAYSVVYRDSKLVVRLLRDSEAFTCPTLVLDATADPELIRAVLPTAKFHSVEVPRKAHVVQVQNRRLSKTALTMDKGQDQTRALVQQSLDRIGKRFKTGLLVTFKALENDFALPPSWKRAHFGAVRGLDQFKDLETVVIVGTYLPPVFAVENEAGALAARLPEVRAFAGEYVRTERAFRLQRGEASASVLGHDDPFAQRVLEQKREAEILQAIDRLRLVHALTPKPVFILSNLPLDLTIDEVVSLEQLAGLDDYVGELFDHLGGVIPLRAAMLHERRPDLFPNLKVAERWAAPFTPRALIESIRQGGVKELRAKGVGQKGPYDTRVLIRGDHPAPRAAVEHHLGALSAYDGPVDREVATFVTVPGTGQTVGARIVQFVDPKSRAPLGWKSRALPPDLYRVLNPPLIEKPRAA